MNRITWVLAFCFVIGGASFLHGQKEDDRKKEEQVHQLMQRKLKGAQKVLEGIAIKDFDMIVNHAEDLMVVSKQVEWQVLKTPQYEVNSNEFRRAVESLIENGKAKNIDGAALAYMDLTLSCVKCHKHVREVRMARR